MTEYQKKAEFVQKYIKPLLKELDDAIVDVVYLHGSQIGEKVFVIYSTYSYRMIYVDFDSELAITKDVIKHLLIENDADWIPPQMFREFKEKSDEL